MDDKLDNKITEWIRQLGLNITNPPQAKEPFHILVMPPQNAGPTLEIVRPPNQNIYLIVMGIGIHQLHQNGLRNMKKEDRTKFLAELNYDLLKMGVDFALMPLGSEIPQAIQISRTLLIEDLRPNDFINAIYAVRNAGLYVILKFSNTFGVAQSKSEPLRYT
ncbi:DUF2299 domain-containing protein [Acidianus sulfidivorans JP7]|uniref:DUF2299 domain-containing protein n=1 Tax=Acidianus sulfidivorans JP7 TaxID=619593 RepID=A0A2U9IK55_9CREN|nr:DUF2299 domain-containing protein [Acidianus sulfidivorans]AWR96429.1 DUF2299 domain-containing protein [Acidianus sulfidivorans JP7]